MEHKTTIFRYIGGILLVSGTTIGAGMLALPIATAFLGFYPSLLVFVFCWLMMLISAFFFLDVNMSIEGEVNLITMAQRTLGTWAKVIAWIVYLLLLYSLIAAYIAASAPVFTTALSYVLRRPIPSWIGPFILPLVFGWFIYLGTLGVDWINKVFMCGLGISFILLIALVPSHIESSLLLHHDYSLSFVALAVITTSFGYHVIIPSLTTYMNHDVKHLRWTLVIGSIVPLIIYIVWQLLVLGTVPIGGKEGLAMAWKLGQSATEPLSKVVQSKILRSGALYFSFFAIVTSFLGVSLSLSDFLTDGFKLKKTWEGRLIACLLTFIPPIIFVFSSSRGFVVALEYAGTFVAILLIFLPAAMALKLKKPEFYLTKYAKILIGIIILYALFIVSVNITQQTGFFESITKKYLGN
ncbi:MAG: Tyrosine-specific transport protein [Chlamydiia bacterium]|nr:Tyrosine-specific transport protein [Chlamydiia bacterium]